MDGFVNLQLPSKGKVYKNFDPAKFLIRPMKGKDEKLIAEINTNNLFTKFEALMKSVSIGLNPEQLTLGDRNKILIWLAANSYGPTVQAEGACSLCYQPIRVTVNLTKIEDKFLPDDFRQPYALSLSGGQSVCLRLLTVDDERKIADVERLGGDAWGYRYALSVVSQEKTVDEVQNWLGELPAGDMARIRAFQAMFDHGPQMETDIICPKCGGAGRMATPFQLEWILPFGQALCERYGASMQAPAESAHAAAGSGGDGSAGA